jgi:class 3 adenylate cyclase
LRIRPRWPALLGAEFRRLIQASGDPSAHHRAALVERVSNGRHPTDGQPVNQALTASSNAWVSSLTMSPEREQLEATIAGLEAQRALLGDATVDAALAPLRARLASLTGAPTVEAPRQTLKQATILFVDIVGSTKLSQHLDPEQASEVMDGALAQFATVLDQHGGKVLRYAGDGVLVVFGADRSREDDPERAVRAGLALLDAGRQQAERVLHEHGYTDFNVRVGVHTGGVLLGGGVEADDGIHGQAVNIAARMEQTAPAGALRISHDTYRHVRGVFDVETQPPLTVKGVDEPLVTYLVLRAKPRSFRVATRGIEGVETRMIGRDAELEQLQDVFKRLYRERKLAVVTVVAEAGLGKAGCSTNSATGPRLGQSTSPFSRGAPSRRP